MRRLYTIPIIALAIYGALRILRISTHLSLATGSFEEKNGRNQPAFSGMEPFSVVEQQNCLSLDSEEDMDKLLSKYKMVYTIQPSKAAGTSFWAFARDCMATKISTYWPWGILNDEEELKKAFTSELEVPSLLNSQVWDPDSICRLMKHATQESLVILSHREETSRLLSAIRQVIGRSCYEEQHEGFKIVNGECRVKEKYLLEMIQTRDREIGGGLVRVLPCKVYECIKNNRPNLVVANYKQASRIQKLLAKHHCPQVTNQEKNIGSDKKLVSVKTKGSLVPLDDWLSAKRQLLEIALQLKSDVSCQATTKDMEDELFACPHETVQISGRTYDDRKIEFPF